MPIVIYAVFDEEYPSNFLDKAPQSYMQGLLGHFLNKLYKLPIFL